MLWRKNRFKLTVVSLLAVALVLGLCGVAAGGMMTDVDAYMCGVAAGGMMTDVDMYRSSPAGIGGSAAVSGGGTAGVSGLAVVSGGGGLDNIPPPLPPDPPWPPVAVEQADDEAIDDEAVCPYYGAIEGFVTEDTGNLPIWRPIAGALVVAWRIGQAGDALPDPAGAVPVPAPQYVRWTTTDRSGHYLLGEMPPGIYAVSACADWYAPASPQKVEVIAGSTSWQNFKLKGAFGALGGRVRDALGNPIAGATILALPKDQVSPTDVEKALSAQELNALRAKAVYQTKTDRNGYYFIPLVKPGTYWVVAVWRNSAQFKEAKVEAKQLIRVDFRFRGPIPVPKDVVEKP
uniref:Carboxypeptidase regulatory-like domain-containing protein n=1 Tax=Ammonifex degensii TaxID=42838 RepID=A0A7C1JLQ4_9THEO